MGAAGQEEGLAHFWVAVLRPRWLPCKNCQIIAFWRKWIDFNKVQPLKVVLHRMNMRKHWTWYCFTTTKYINLCDSNLIVQLFTFVCLFFSREKSRQTKVLKKTLLHHWHYFDSPRQVQRRFSDFNSFHFSDTEAFNFRFALLLKNNWKSFRNPDQSLSLHFFRLLCLGELGPLYPGTKAPELQTNYGGVRTLLHMAAILNHPRDQKDWDP